MNKDEILKILEKELKEGNYEIKIDIRYGSDVPEGRTIRTTIYHL